MLMQFIYIGTTSIANSYDCGSWHVKKNNHPYNGIAKHVE